MVDQILRLRPDVKTGKLQGVIDLERFNRPKGKSIEAEAEAFLNATFPTGEIRRLVEQLDKRLNSQAEETGLFLAEGTKGLGKSHVLLLVLHLLSGSPASHKWLEEKGLKLDLPANLKILSRKFTDFPLDSLWGLVGETLGVRFTDKQPPDLEQFRAATKDCTLVLVLDELESGITSIADEALRQQNINFLQMLSEEANRADSHVVLLGSIYDGNREPGLTLKRVPRVEIRFSDPDERRRVLFHRLFEVPPMDRNPDIDATVTSFLNTWKRFEVKLPNGYAASLRESYPFSPELLDAVLVQIPQLRGGFQGTRGTLGFLASLLKINPADNLITMADADLADAELRSWLSDLDPSQNLIICAESNLRELKDQPLAGPIASTVLFGSLIPTARNQGVDMDALARQVVAPGSDFNAFSQTVTAFERYASYFHRKEGGFVFDTRENAYSKVELGSLSVEPAEAWARLVDWWRLEVFKDANTMVLDEIGATRERLDAMAHDDLCLVVAPRRLTDTDRQQLYFGLKNRNTVLLIEPKDDKANIRGSADLLKLAQKFVAAERLATASSDDSSKASEFTKIAADDKKAAVLSLRKITLAYVQIMPGRNEGAGHGYLLENLPSGASAEDIRTHLNRTLYPPTLIREHLQDRATEIIGMKVQQVEEQYRKTLGYPVLVFRTSFQEAMEALVEAGTVVGLEPSGRPPVCGSRPHLRPEDLRNAVICKPFEAPPEDLFKPGSRDPVGPSPSPTSTSGGSGVSTHTSTSGPAPTIQKNQKTTPFCTTKADLRQEVARLLDENSVTMVETCRIDLTYDARTTDMSALPSFLRGTLQGAGTFNGEATLTFAGPFTKAAMESMMERLPDFTPGSCRVILTWDFH